MDRVVGFTPPSRSRWLQREVPRWIPAVFYALAYVVACSYFGLMSLSAVVADNEMYGWRLLLGPALALAFVLLAPPFRQERLSARLHFLLMAAFILPWAIHAAILLSKFPGPVDRQLFLGLAGPREEGLKLLCVLFLAWTTTKAKGWPTRLILIGFFVGVLFSGVETAGSEKLPTLHPRGVFDRITSLAKHGLYTAIAVSGFDIARILRSRWRWFIPFATFAAGASAHSVGNLYLRRIHARLLNAVNDFPEVMTSEQWFNAPHYDLLHYGVVGAFVLILLAILGFLVTLIFRLARRSGWTSDRENHPRHAE